MTVISKDERISALPNQIVEFNYPAEEHGLEFRVSLNNCLHRYHVPKYPPEDYFKLAGFDGMIVVQLEPDLSLYIAPPNAKSAMVVATLEPMQTDGFPISPDGPDCT